MASCRVVDFDFIGDDGTEGKEVVGCYGYFYYVDGLVIGEV